MKQGHDSRAIGNIFVRKFREDERELTIMPLVKLVYIAHGWTLGYTGEPLVRHPAEAWRHGPVIPEVYNAFRSQGVVITQEAIEEMPDGQRSEYTAELNDDQKFIVEGVYGAYAEMSAFTLSKMTHYEGTPWDQCKAHLYSLISDDVIREYYKGRVDALREKP